MKNSGMFAVLIFLANISSAKDLRIIVQDYLPLAGRDDSGKITGLHVDFMEAVCVKLKYNCKFEQLPIRRGEDMIATGEADIFVALSPGQQRKKIAYFGPMITSSPFTFFVKKGNANKFSKIEDVIGNKVGVYGPSATQRSLEDINKKLGNKITIDLETVTELPFKKLDGGRYGASGLVYSVKPVGLHMIKKLGLAIEPVGFNTEKLYHGMMMSKKKFTAEEYKKMWIAVKEIIASAEGEKIFTKWPVDPYDGPVENSPE